MSPSRKLEMTKSANGTGKSDDSEASKAPSSGNVSHAGDNASVTASFKLLLLTMMVLQNSSTVLVGRYSRSAVPAADMYEVSHLLLICELAKLILSCCLEFYSSEGKFMESVKIHILDRPLDALKISVPALLYLVQNTLLYVALENLTAPLFQVTYQGKLVTTAIVSVIMLQHSYKVRQWICLVGLSLGVAIVVLGERKVEDEEKDKSNNSNLVVGLVAVTIACLSSALAGVYFEKVLKKPGQSSMNGAKTPNASVWMRNIQLAFFSVVIAAFQGGLKETGKPYLHGFGFWVWVLVALQSGGGLLVAAVIKYADNVLKGLATGVSVVLSSTLSMMIFATPLGPNFLLGGSLILTSVWFFSNPLPVWLESKMKRAEAQVLPV
ncbi:hypothetical protein ACA910_010237 [Epithemia clementina (nom. ined.)]